MGLEIAVDELYSTGWSGLDSAGCVHDTDGRWYPTVERVRREFGSAGFDFEVDQADGYDVYRGRWQGPAGEDGGSVVGHTAEEAAVYALAQHRRQLVATGV